MGIPYVGTKPSMGDLDAAVHLTAVSGLNSLAATSMRGTVASTNIGADTGLSSNLDVNNIAGTFVFDNVISDNPTGGSGGHIQRIFVGALAGEKVLERIRTKISYNWQAWSAWTVIDRVVGFRQFATLDAFTTPNGFGSSFMAYVNFYMGDGNLIGLPETANLELRNVIAENNEMPASPDYYMAQHQRLYIIHPTLGPNIVSRWRVQNSSYVYPAWGTGTGVWAVETSGTGSGPDEASDAEVQAMTDADKFITPAGLAAASVSAPTANRIVRRDGSGRFQAVAPSASADVAIKSTVDDAVTDIKTTTLGGLKLEKITAVAFAALGTKDPNTVYHVVG